MHAVAAPYRPVRPLSITIFLMSVSSGIYMSCGVVYFTNVVRLTPGQISAGLSVSGLFGIGAAVLIGKLSDRFGPRQVMCTNLAISASATLGFLAVHQFWGFVLTVAVSASTRTSAMVVVGPVVHRLVPVQPNEYRARLRSINNMGMAVGATGAVTVAKYDSVHIYQALIIVSGACLFAAVAWAGTLPRLEPIVTKRPVGRWSVLRDRPYLALTAVDAVLSLQYRILSVTIPLWILSYLTAPSWLAPAVFILNTAIVVVWQVRIGRTIDSPRSAGIALRSSGWAFLCACVLFGLSSQFTGVAAVIVVALGATALSIGELWQTAGGFEASNSLAPPTDLGQYLGVFSAGMRVADCAGPILLAWLCLGLGSAGWLVVGIVLASTGLAAPSIIRWAEATGGFYHRLHDGTEIMYLDLDATAPIPKLVETSHPTGSSVKPGKVGPRHRRPTRRHLLAQRVRTSAFADHR